MNQYIIDNSKSVYFGITCYELEQYEAEDCVWIKVSFDAVVSGNFQEVQMWFKSNELLLV